MTLDEAAEMMSRSAAACEMKLRETLFAFGELVAKTAKDKIGNEQDDWPPLSDETIDDKEKRGYPTPSPLLREGTLLDSIVAPALDEIVALTLEVGSTDPVAVFQEMGTSRMPPRPFLSTAMIESLPFVEERLAADAAELLTGARPDAH